MIRREAQLDPRVIKAGIEEIKEKKDCMLRVSHGNVVPYSAEGEMKPFLRCLNSLAAKVSVSCEARDKAK